MGNLRAILAGGECVILAASIKSAAEATEILLAGAQHISVPYDVITEMAENSLSQMAISEFDKNLSQVEGVAGNHQ